MRLRVLCARCGTALAPTMSGLRCPRMSACGFGGMVETIQFQPLAALASSATDAEA
ncbi:MAG TPA: hypothetical protein VM370_11925 [Candidatus Thermoplasmatota archaeon]|nr:hypothetical protein [Candidatus Thermoplasmatota archaeon]